MKGIKNISAVIFDMDGTILDTEKYYQSAWPDALRHFGFFMDADRELCMRSLGRPFAQQKLNAWYGQTLDMEAIKAYRNELFEGLIDRYGLLVKPGAAELLDFLHKKGIAAAVATSTDEKRTRDYLTKAGLWESFDHVICATMVPRGKPAPDIYRFACETLCLPPSDCLAVEDAPNGVRSAYRAGCPVVMVPDLTQPDEELLGLLYAKCDTLFDIIKLWEREPNT